MSILSIIMVNVTIYCWATIWLVLLLNQVPMKHESAIWTNNNNTLYVHRSVPKLYRIIFTFFPFKHFENDYCSEHIKENNAETHQKLRKKPTAIWNSKLSYFSTKSYDLNRENPTICLRTVKVCFVKTLFDFNGIRNCSTFEKHKNIFVCSTLNLAKKKWRRKS